VLGERTAGKPFTADDRPAPEDGYGLAKQRIEEAMREAIGGDTSLTILRPPLVYGPGVKANFLAMLRLVDRGLPLPLAGIANRRSFVFLDNLVDLIEAALAHPAPEGTFLLRDDEEISTPDLLRRIARQLGRPSRLFPCPAPLLRWAAGALGRRGMADRLLQSLRIDDGATRARLGWSPRIGLDDGLAATCRWYREKAARR
jgi:UDP-glucose 4-epimerase